MSNQPQSSSSAQASSGSSNVPASDETCECDGYVNSDLQTSPFGAYIIVLALNESEGPLNDASGNPVDANQNPNHTVGLKVDSENLAAATRDNGQDLNEDDKLRLTYHGGVLEERLHAAGGVCHDLAQKLTRRQSYHHTQRLRCRER